MVKSFDLYFLHCTASFYEPVVVGLRKSDTEQDYLRSIEFSGNDIPKGCLEFGFIVFRGYVVWMSRFYLQLNGVFRILFLLHNSKLSFKSQNKYS